MDESVVLDRVDCDHFFEDNFVALGSVVKTDVYGVGAVVDMQGETFVAFVVADSERCEELWIFVFEGVFFQIGLIVFIKRIAYFIVDFSDVFR